MGAFYLAIGGDLDPTKRSYFREEWNEKSWWLPWHYDLSSHQWLRSATKHEPVVMPTPFRTLDEAEEKRRRLASAYSVYIVNATTHQRLDPNAPVRTIPPNAPICLGSIR